MSEPFGIADLLPDRLCRELRLRRAYQGRQIMSWLKRGVLDYAQMSNLPGALREQLAVRSRILTSQIDVRESDESGTEKLRLRLHDGQHIEMVLMQPPSGRRTICVSTQVGCAMGCRFCRTGAMGFRRNLEAREIVEQVLHARSTGGVDNIVLMGMGEPLANWGPVRGALEVLTSPEGHGYSPRRVTVSTVGLISGIRAMRDDPLPLRLAVSLVSARPEARRALVPASRGNSLPDLRAALGEYQSARGKRITLEVVLLRGWTDGPEDADHLVRFADGLRVLVNLIPWNVVPGMDYASPREDGVERFRRRLRSAGIPVAVRRSMGRGVSAACGQLGSPGSPATPLLEHGSDTPNPRG